MTNDFKIRKFEQAGKKAYEYFDKYDVFGTKTLLYEFQNRVDNSKTFNQSFN
jgi:hypothetical protein